MIYDLCYIKLDVEALENITVADLSHITSVVVCFISLTCSLQLNISTFKS